MTKEQLNSDQFEAIKFVATSLSHVTDGRVDAQTIVDNGQMNALAENGISRESFLTSLLIRKITTDTCSVLS